jgi:hypothetical protein
LSNEDLIRLQQRSWDWKVLLQFCRKRMSL